MGSKMSVLKFDELLSELQRFYKIYAPVTMKGKGTFSDTDSIRYKAL